MGIAAALLTLASALPAKAQNAAWTGAVDGDWSNPANWNPGIPGGTGTASFGPSSNISIGFGGVTTTDIGTLSFSDPGYQFTICSCEVVNINGAGVVSSLANAPTFMVDGTLSFYGSSSAGFANIFDIGFGFIQFFGYSTAANANIALNGGSLAFYGQSTAANATITNFGGQIVFDVNSNAGTALIGNMDGSVYFSGQSSAANSTITNQVGYSNNLISFSDRSTAANATILNESGLVVFSGRSDAGTANITSNASGLPGIFPTVMFDGQASAAKSIITMNNDGWLLFDSRSTAGSAAITLNGSSELWFMGRSTGGLAEITANSGTLVDFSGTRGPNNNGQVSAGSIAGDGTFWIGHGNILTVGGNNKSTEVTGVIQDGCGCGSGGGSLVKVGTGTLTLSGLNTYTGETVVNGGTLLVDGSIENSSSLTVNVGATLAGSFGILPATFINAGGTLSPGNGTTGNVGNFLEVRGALTFAPGSTYAVDVAPSGAPGIPPVFLADLVTVVGPATLAGTLKATGTGGPGYTVGAIYPVLGTAPVGVNTFNGTRFDNLFIAGSFGSTKPIITYNSTDDIVFLQLIQGEVSSQLIKGATQNQIEVARGIDNALLQGADFGSFTPLYNLTGDAFLKALDQIGGEANTGVFQTVYQSVSNFISSMLNPFNSGRGIFGPAVQYSAEDDDEADAYAQKRRVAKKAQQAMSAAMPVKAEPARDGRYAVWANGYGGNTSIDGNNVVGSHQTNVRGYGFAAGLDFRVAPEALVGFAMAGGGSSWGLSEGLGGGKTDNFHLGAYGSLRYGPAYLSAAMAYGRHWVSTSRTVVVPGFASLEGDYDANSFGGRIEAGYRYGQGSFGITPYAALQASVVRLPGYTENATAGDNAFALQYGRQSDSLYRTELGSWVDHSRVIPGGVMTLRARAAWAHDEGADRALTGGFPYLPGSTFLVQGASPGNNLALLSAGAEWRYWNGMSIAARFDSELSDRSRGFGGSGVFRYVW